MMRTQGHVPVREREAVGHSIAVRVPLLEDATGDMNLVLGHRRVYDLTATLEVVQGVPAGDTIDTPDPLPMVDEAVVAATLLVDIAVIVPAEADGLELILTPKSSYRLWL